MTKIRKILILILSALILFTGNIYAAVGEVTLTASKTELKPGETFTITVSANNDSGAIDGLSSKMKYNENILEVVSSELVDTENWAALDEMPELIAIWKTTTSETSSADIYEITFKVKEGLVPQDTDVTLTDIVLSSISGQESIDDLTKTIQIKTENENEAPEEDGKDDIQTPSDKEDNGDEEEKEPSDKDEVQKPENDEEQKNEEEDKKENGTITNNGGNGTVTGKGTYSDSSVSNKGLPFAGGMLSKIIVTLTVAFAVLGIRGYVLYKRYRKI